jgi:hypothetical protein
VKTILQREDTHLYRMAHQLDMLVAEAEERQQLEKVTQADLLWTMCAIRRLQEVDEPTKPPSLLRLLVELRKPEARRGLHRLVMLLESLGTVEQEGQDRKEAPL